ncbi:MAG: nicotinate (nicotinamide) nucleotide adenylyltransferase [Chitinophagaceae bacterium]|nr:nicotinate (nicotinamide) nucleotide adenylyltransferase [Chitinophagaceae bacterium]
MNIALFFGSFNPPHIGHMIVANHALDSNFINEVWFVISPQSPFKVDKQLIDANMRLEMVQLAIANNDNFKAYDIEFSLRKPNYTIDTMRFLHKTFPMHTFSILMGADNLFSFYKWKNYEEILNNYNLIIYPRKGVEQSFLQEHPNVQMLNTPLIDTSSSYIRERIEKKMSIRYMVSNNIIAYIEERKLYQL